MSNITPWFGRQFQFPIPIELLPQIEARLRGTPARLEELLRDGTGEILLRKPDGAWSAQEHAGHLLTLEALWAERLQNFRDLSNTLAPADLSNRPTDLADYNARPLTEVLSNFRAARHATLNAIPEHGSPAFDHALPHPRLQTPMRLVDHLYFVAEHDDHHLARIWELLSA